MRSERGQGTVEWVGLVLLVSVAMLGLVAAGARVPGASLARALADRLLCAASLADGCGDEPALIAAYGTEVGRLVRRHTPMLAFERGSRAVPVDFRRCRSSECGDASGEGLDPPDRRATAGHRLRPRGRLPAGCGRGDRSGRRRLLGRARRQPLPAVLALLRRLGDAARRPGGGGEGLPRRRLGERPVPHRPRRQRRPARLLPPRLQLLPLRPNWLSDAGIVSHDGWGPETHLLLVSGGSHAGNASPSPRSTATPPAAGSTSSRSSRSPPPTARVRDLAALAEEGVVRPRSTDGETD